MLSQALRQTLHQRASACQPRRVRPSLLRRRAVRRGRAAGRCASYAGPGHRQTSPERKQPRRSPSRPLPSQWLHALSAGVSRLLTMARRELTAALIAQA